MLRLHKDASWIASHAWSFRFLVLASVLSGAEAALPLFSEHPPLPRRLFALLMFLVVALALVARLVVQQHPPELFDDHRDAAPSPPALTPEQISAISHTAALAALHATGNTTQAAQ